MAIIRKLIAQDDNDDNQWLKVDHDSRYIENDMDDWQYLFGPNSALSTSNFSLKIAAKFDDDTFNNIKVTGYLYDNTNASIGNVAGIEFKIYKVVLPDWSEILITNINGSQMSNNYFYINPTIVSLAPIDFFGGDTIMIEATAIRLGVTYRDRIYVNHLGIYDNVNRLRGDVEFLDLTKVDE